MPNIKAPSLLIKKLWPRLKFLKVDETSKQEIKCMTRYAHVKYKALPFRSYGLDKVFVQAHGDSKGGGYVNKLSRHLSQ